MRVLLTTWAWPSHLMPLVQLGWALRADGHDVVVVSSPALVDTIATTGLPAAAVGEDFDVWAKAQRYFAWLVEQPKPVRWEDTKHWGAGNVAAYRVLAERTIDPFLEFARSWEPDMIVFDPTTFVGPLAAAVLGIPAVRHIWGMDYTHRTHEFEPEALQGLCARLALSDVDTLGAATVDPCPPSLQFATDVVSLPIRYAPYNGPATVRQEHVTPPRRQRFLVLGSSAVEHVGGTAVPFVGPVLDGLAGFDAEVLAVVPGAERERLRVPENVRVIDPTPLHLLLPHVDLVVHQGGGGAVMAALHQGVPQLLIPLFTDHVSNAEQLADSGAGSWLFAGTVTAAEVREQVTDLLAQPGFLHNARRLRAEMHASPGAAEVVDALVALRAEWAA